MSYDPDIETRVRLGERIACPHGCNQLLRVWGVRDGTGKPPVVSCGITLCIHRQILADEGKTVGDDGVIR